METFRRALEKSQSHSYRLCIGWDIHCLRLTSFHRVFELATHCNQSCSPSCIDEVRLALDATFYVDSDSERCLLTFIISMAPIFPHLLAVLFFLLTLILPQPPISEYPDPQ
ncbi:hypothetical protein BDZ94DRAFT_985176 [Collybia nuda]|uniref:Uncharacterized protein n=1 Tax=Collybia nuda TaxID=64659 RepID=A0A9P6CBS2_9AGAR|nr:hypothetical protein BDZ94DRAFT_985176 [Collybia nuda]